MLFSYICQQQICPSNVTYVPFMPISLCADIGLLSIYLLYINSPQSKVSPQGLYTYISHYWHVVLKKYTWHLSCVCPTALILYSTCRPHITANTGQNNNKLHLFYHTITIYVSTSNMPLTCHIYSIYATYIICTCMTTTSVYAPHMNSIQSIMWSEALV